MSDADFDDDYTPPKRPDPATVTASDPCVVVGDNGSLMWVPIDHDNVEDGENLDDRTIVASGVPGILHGTPLLVSHTRAVLDGATTESTLPSSWSTWTLTSGRDTLPDVIAAMTHVLARPTLNDAATEVMNTAMPELVDPENNRDDVIY